jgi:prolipoprotein diacylglyceryltransferase
MWGYIPLFGGIFVQIPQVVRLFGQPMQVYTLVIGVAIVIVMALAVLHAPRGARWRKLDACLIALGLALVCARFEHVLLRWDYYAEHLDQALDFARGGLGWHGAVLGAWVGITIFYGVGRGRMRPAPALCAFALPLLAAAAWVGCAAAGCAYGAEVRTLADYLPGVTAELRDVYGIAAPRWNTPLYGVILAGATAIFAIGVQYTAPRLRHLKRPLSHFVRPPMKWAGYKLSPATQADSPMRRISPWRGRFRPSRGISCPGDAFYLALALLAFGMFMIGYARADAVVMIAGVRGDQVLDVATLIVALTAWVSANTGTT